ncbi:disulfide bond formation protein B [uncultured Neptuniibacter sp.]|uniref:disulfide bond formation protein B n=1 Tax=uncultured Neptuniibacter sp. TaxID=502143 RepID=UPI00261CC72C|nr:disulfide bond formation protein B [uncultured Neptuniibacter sp.]
MLDKFSCFSRSIWYWLSLIIIGLLMEGIALFYQYGLDYGPCVLCIHVRIWVMFLVLVATLGLLTRKHQGMGRVSHLLVFLSSLGLSERSYQTLAVERGWIIDSCSMDSGLPEWFALDKWIPHMFEPWEPCGYTPELLLKITMAEGLIAFSLLLSLTALTLFILQFRTR